MTPEAFDLMKKLRHAAHDRCKGLRPAGYPRGVEDLFEYKSADLIVELSRALEDAETGLEVVARERDALQEQLEAVRQMLESAESYAWEETIAKALRLATPTGEQR